MNEPYEIDPAVLGINENGNYYMPAVLVATGSARTLKEGKEILDGIRYCCAPPKRTRPLARSSGRSSMESDLSRTNWACHGWQCKRPVEFLLNAGASTIATCFGHINEELFFFLSEGEDGLPESATVWLRKVVS